MADTEGTVPAKAIPPRPFDYPIHPYCNLLPRASADDEAALEFNVRKVGFQEPAILVKVGRHSAMLDGQTRQKILLKLYDEGVYEDEQGRPLLLAMHHLPDATTPEEMIAIAESKNLRRNLNAAQKACRAVVFHKERVRMAKQMGTPLKVEGDLADFLVKTYGGNRRYLVHVNALEKGDRKLFDAVYSGAMTLAQAHKAHQVAKGRITSTPAASGTGFKDANDLPVPKSLDVVFQDVEHFDVISAELRKLSKRIKVLAESPSGAFIEYGPLQSSIANVAAAVSKSAPHVVCPHCKGKGCDKCKKAGFMTSLMLSVGAQRAEEKTKKEAEAKAAEKKPAKAETPAAEVPPATVPAAASAKARGKPETAAETEKGAKK